MSPRKTVLSSLRLDVCHWVLPRYLSDVDLLEWIHRYTVDASQALNPRNVLTLVRLARQRQLEVYDRNDPKLEAVSSLISANSMINGLKGLSEVRLEDTVYAEFNSLRPVVETLRGKPVRFTGKELSGYIRASQKSDRFKTSLEALEYAGIISVTGQGVITVARLYRPALRISRGRHSGISIAEERSLEKRVDLAMVTWPQGGLPVELPDMSAQERKFIHDYVRKMYPDYSTAAFSGGKLPELKTLVIQKRTQNASTISSNANITRKSPRGSNGKLQSYDPAHIELLLKLRNEAAGADGYFIGPALEGSLALTLVEIDRLLRKNKARRRVLGILTDDPNVRDLENGEVQLILGSCNGCVFLRGVLFRGIPVMRRGRGRECWRGRSGLGGVLPGSVSCSSSCSRRGRR